MLLLTLLAFSVAQEAVEYHPTGNVYQRQRKGTGGELLVGPKVIRTYKTTPENRTAAPGGGSHLKSLADIGPVLTAVAARERQNYQSADPYCHTVIDGLIPDAAARVGIKVQKSRSRRRRPHAAQ